MLSKKSISTKFKEIGNHGLIYGLGTAIESLLNFILLPLFLNRFQPNVFGAFTFIQLLATMMASLLYFGSSSALSRFYFETNNVIYRKFCFSVSLNVTIVGSIIISFLGYFLGNEISLFLFNTEIYKNAILFLFLVSAFSILNNNFYILLRLLKKSISFITIKCLAVCSSLGFIFLFINIKIRIDEAVSLGLLCGQILVLFIMLIMLYTNIIFKVKKNIILKYFKFGFPIALSGLLLMLLDWVIRFFVKKDLGLSELGIYSMALKISTLIQAGYILPFSLIWSTIRMEYRKDENTGLFFSKVANYFIFLGLILVFIGSIFIKDIVPLFTNNNNYSNSLIIIPFMLLSQLIWGTVNILDYGLYVNNKTINYLIYNIMSLVFVIITCFFFLERTGIVGAALINIAGNFITSFLIFYNSNKFFKISLDYKMIFLTGCISLLFFLVSHWVQSFNLTNNINLILNGFITIAFIITAISILPKTDKSKSCAFIKSGLNSLQKLIYR